jgi:LPS-assembly lipoprotein
LQPPARLLALLGLGLLLVTGCGFQSQGKASLPASLRTIHVQTDDRYSPFYRELTTRLRGSGVALGADPDTADAVIRISRDNTGQRVLSVSTRNVPAEYDVFYTVSYDIWVNGAEVFEPQTLTLNRDYTYDATEVLGKSREEAIIREALAADLARLVTQRLNALN